MKRTMIRERVHRIRRAMSASLILCLALVAAPLAAEDSHEPYDPQEAGNPVRVVAYILHPVGVVIDTLIFRPAYWLGRQEPFRTLFGVTDD